MAAIREQNGRFLEKDSSKGTWFDIGDKKAIEKTSQALREGQPKLRQKIADLGVNAAGLLGPQGLAVSKPTHRYTNSDPNQLTAASFAACEYASSSLQPQQQHVHINVPRGSGIGSPSVMHLSMPPPLPPNQQVSDVDQRMSLIGIQEDRTVQMRPSILQRGSVVGRELGIDQSNRSIMSDFSDYGLNESFKSSGSYRMSSDWTAAAVGAVAWADSSPHEQKPPPGPNVDDRRTFFAKMKYSRPSSGRMGSSSRVGSSRNIPSDACLSDGMPEIHMVDSGMSLYSNLSSVGDIHTSVPGDMIGSRRSVMSGLSRISDTSDANSIISDLSKKIGNVSTRSMAMSEISIMDDIDSVDTSSPADKQGVTNVASSPHPMTSSSMEFE